jgi:ankyrin repeat protein
MRGNLEDVMRLLVTPQLALSPDSSTGATPLHKAVLYGHPKIVRFLINNFPESLRSTDRKGRTPLHYAAVKKELRHIYKILVNAGSNPNVKDKVIN